MATLDEWAASAATIANKNSKLSLTYSTNAINKYLAGGTLTATQQAQVDKALKTLGAPPKPASSSTTTDNTTAAGALGSKYYIDPTAAYAPISQMLTQQKAAATLRNQQNAADIKTIFGTLATVRAEDRQKIQQQYATSLQQQQEALAGRTAETRAATAAGQQGAQMAAGELGTTTEAAPQSLTAQAAEQGIARSNEYQTTWNALQQVMNQQAQNDVLASIRGYDYQQVASLDALRKQLEDTLNNLSGQELQNQSALAGAKLSAQQNAMQTELGIQGAQAQAQADEAASNLAAKTKLQVAQTAADARIQAAEIAAAAKKKSGSGTSSGTTSTDLKTKNLSDFQSKLSKAGIPFADVQDVVNMVRQRVATQRKITTDKVSKKDIDAGLTYILGEDNAKTGRDALNVELYRRLQPYVREYLKYL